MLIDVTITGLTPLIFDRYNPDLQIDKGPKSVGKGTELSPKEQAKAKLFLDEKTNKPVLPQEYLLKAIIEAGRFIKIGKRQLSTRDETIVTSFLAIEGVYFPIKTGKDGWRVLSKGVVNQKTKDRVLSHRPIIDEWEVSFTIDLDTSEARPSTARDLVDRAGKAIGIGVMRPARKGPYGRFRVTRWAERQDDVEHRHEGMAEAAE